MSCFINSTGLPVSSVIAGLAIPALQAAATLTLMNFQKNAADEQVDDAQRIMTNAQKAYCECLNDLLPLLEQATDDVPTASDYNPVSIGGSFFDSLKQAVQLADFAQEYGEVYGKAGRETDMARMKALNPLYDSTQEKIWQTLSSLVCGETPVDVAIEIAGSAAETNAINGRIGTCQLTSRRLGVNSLAMQQLGRSEKRLEEQGLNQNVSPLERNPDLQKFVVDPTQRVEWDIQQAQLIQASIQNALNLCAKKDPYLLQEWQMRFECCKTELQVALAKASAEIGFVPNYLGAFGPQINSFFGGLGGQSTQQPQTQGQDLTSGIFGSSSSAKGGLGF